MTRVLVLLAVHNGRQWLPDQLDSLFAQTGVDVSVMASDDCSNDGSLDVLQSYASETGMKVLAFDQPAGGAGPSFIRLLRCSSFEDFDYVAFSDQDDVWMHDKLRRAVTLLDSSGAVGYSAAVEAFWPDGRTSVLAQNDKMTDLDFVFEGAGQGCSFLLTAGFAGRVKQFCTEHSSAVSGIHYHDWLTYALSRAWGESWQFDSRPCLRYRQHAHNDTGARGALAGKLKRLTLIRRGWYGKQVRQIIRAVSLAAPGNSCLPSDFIAVWNSPPRLSRRARLAVMLARRGRRRFSDRIVLSVSSSLGWI